MSTSGVAPADRPAAPGQGDGEDSAHPASVLGKAHLVLAAFASGPGRMGLTELSRRSNLPKATVHRLSTELTALGYMSRSGSSYQLGWRIFELGRLVPGLANLSSAARPVLVDVRAAVRAIVVHLTVPQSADTLYVERLAGRREIGIVSVMGQRAPSLLTASGRVFLAASPDRTELLGTYDQQTTQRFARATGCISDAAVHRLLDRIDERRWALEQEECVSGMKTFAVPISYGGEIVAGVSASVTTDRHDDQAILHTLWEASADISRGLHSRPARSHEVVAAAAR